MMLAFDRALPDVQFDRDGRLRVRANISMAAVSQYLGTEIPQYSALGLDPDRLYAVLRDPDELEAAAESFDGVPLLIDHRPISASAPGLDLTAGAISNVEYEHPFLIADVTIWTDAAIAGVRDGSRNELSSAYTYRAVPAGGMYGGKHYDFVMRGLCGNHVALVPTGRNGSECSITMAMDSRSAVWLAAERAKGVAYAKAFLARTMETA